MSGADTIYALSSAPGKAGVAVVRISGKEAPAILASLMQQAVLPPPRRAVFTKLHAGDGHAIDEALALYFAAPNSFTGEEVVELQLHGSRAVLHALFDALARFPATRMAEPGEFTRRAFLNGKLDLAQTEGLADLIASETEGQRKQALAQMGGALSDLYESWRRDLMRALAYVEADIDFPDEELPADIVAARMAALESLKNAVKAHLADERRGERLREGIMLAIVGAPNAGKSSLLNCLAAREAAIVSDLPGTTRDVIEVHLDLGGYPVTVADTAGLRDTSDRIEAEGVARAKTRAGSADFKLVLFDATQAPDAASLALIDAHSFVLLTKSDLPGAKNAGAFFGANQPAANLAPNLGCLALSTRTNEGVGEALQAITKHLQALFEAGGNAPALTRPRHREALQHTLHYLDAALQGYAKSQAPELVAEDLRASLQQLGRITGRVDVEDLLDVIFRDFCIGK